MDYKIIRIILGRCKMNKEQIEKELNKTLKKALELAIKKGIWGKNIRIKSGKFNYYVMFNFEYLRRRCEKCRQEIKND